MLSPETMTTLLIGCILMKFKKKGINKVEWLTVFLGNQKQSRLMKAKPYGRIRERRNAL